ncbi:hypothetical protein C8F01DRAFT_548621 [Mycena amicta]|nr:hypothetical protein C8F01DRAFT_548621 [Mycena amicta]
MNQLDNSPETENSQRVIAEAIHWQATSWGVGDGSDKNTGPTDKANRHLAFRLSVTPESPFRGCTNAPSALESFKFLPLLFSSHTGIHPLLLLLLYNPSISLTTCLLASTLLLRLRPLACLAPRLPRLLPLSTCVGHGSRPTAAMDMYVLVNRATSTKRVGRNMTFGGMIPRGRQSSGLRITVLVRTGLLCWRRGGGRRRRRESRRRRRRRERGRGRLWVECWRWRGRHRGRSRWR